MAPSASKQKRLAEKAIKGSLAKANGTTTSASESVNGGSGVATPTTNPTSAAGSTDDLSMAKLQIATDRCDLF